MPARAQGGGSGNAGSQLSGKGGAKDSTPELTDEHPPPPPPDLLPDYGEGDHKDDSQGEPSPARGISPYLKVVRALALQLVLVAFAFCKQAIIRAATRAMAEPSAPLSVATFAFFVLVPLGILYIVHRTVVAVLCACRECKRALAERCCCAKKLRGYSTVTMTEHDLLGDEDDADDATEMFVVNDEDDGNSRVRERCSSSDACMGSGVKCSVRAAAAAPMEDDDLWSPALSAVGVTLHLAQEAAAARHAEAERAGGDVRDCHEI